MADPIIESINVRMGDKTVKLTIEQARQLREHLNTLFGQQAAPVVVPTIIERERYVPRPYDPYPYIPWYPRYTNPWITWCATDNSATLCLSE